VQRIIGIDIGLRFTGYGIVDFIGQKELIVEGGVI
jgi:Holliday junction resolvasome RuvABC endonuclease subunit